MKTAIILLALAVSAFAAKIDPEVFTTLARQDSLTVTISFRNSKTREIRQNFISLARTLSTRSAKLNTHYNMLKDHADTIQANVRQFLDKQRTLNSNLKIHQLWISNEIIVKNADAKLIEQLQQFQDINEIYADRIIPLERPEGTTIHPDGIPMPRAAQWGVEAVHAEDVWATGNRGQGVVVANIDTGVRGTHEALRNNHRAQNGWLDPAFGSTTPTDNDGHGTHTMGTIAGQTNGIGVAPDATWIACVGCGLFGCSLADLRACGNWAACPTDAFGLNADCATAPNLVSNSWGGGQGDDFYDEIIASWKAVDIAPLFSQGNSGPSCGSANSPGDAIEAIGVGSTTSSNELSSFSSVGPTYRGRRIKPDISGPGSAVVSSYNSGDTAYSSLSGTSMACPHVAGVSALLYAAHPGLTVEELKEALYAGAQPIQSSGRNCGDIDEGTYPNHHAGHGRVDALASINSFRR